MFCSLVAVASGCKPEEWCLLSELGLLWVLDWTQTLIGPRSEILFVTLDGVDNRVMGKEPDLTVS